MSSSSSSSSASSYGDERRVALHAVASASRLARTLQNDLIINATQSKSDASPVTVADFAVQALIVAQLRRAFPSDRFIAEESVAALNADTALRDAVVAAVGLPQAEVLDAIAACDYHGGDAARTWILDPIDGTRGFIAFRQYCIALALLDAGVVRLGVLGCPALPLNSMQVAPGAETGCLFHAMRGQGTFQIAESTVLDGGVNAPTGAAPLGVGVGSGDGDGDDKGKDSLESFQQQQQQLPVGSPRDIMASTNASCDELGVRVSVSDDADPVTATFCESVESGHSSHDTSARVAAILGVQKPPVRMDSQAKYGCMARGDASIFLRFPRKGYVENVWDSAPATIVLEEAGGRVTDGRGRDLNFSLGRKMDNDDGIVATNGKFHDTVIAAVQQALQQEIEE